MGNDPNSEAVSNGRKSADYEKDAKYRIKGRRYHEKRRIRSRGQVVCVARTEMREYNHTEKQPAGNGINGRYQEKSGLFTIHFNHTGTYVEAVMAVVFHGDHTSKNPTHRWQAGKPRPIMFLWGREQKDGTYLLKPNRHQRIRYRTEGESKDAADALTYRVVKSGGKLRLKEWKQPKPESSAHVYDLISNEPDRHYDSITYMKDVLDTLPSSMSEKRRWQIRMYEHAPLTKQYYRWLVRALTEEKEYDVFGKTRKHSLAGLIRAYAKAPKGSRVADKSDREEAINRIGFFLNYAVFPQRGPDAWHSNDLLLATFFAKLILAKTLISVPGSENRTYMQWLQEITDQHARDGNGELGGARKFLDLAPRTKRLKPRFKYVAEFRLVGLQVGWWIFGGGYFEGSVTIKQYVNGRDNHRWKRTYHAWMYVGGSNSGVSIEFNPEVVGYSDADWSRLDVHGSFSVLSAEGAGHLVEIDGSENFPPLRLEKSEALGRAPSLSGATGTIEALDEYAPKPPTPPNTQGPYYRWFSGELVRRDTSVHFRCGSAKLTDAAIRRIGFLCARELRSFMIRDNYLWVHGHADRVDNKDFNQELSELRARNTLNVIRAILGQNLKVKDVDHKGFGESRAMEDKQPNGVPDRRYRRVDIILGGRLVGTLYGE